MNLVPWVSGDLILNEGEVLWLAACLHSSSALIDRESDHEGPVDRLLLQRMESISKYQRDQFDQQWEQAGQALDWWRGQQTTPPTDEEDHYAEGAIRVVLGVNARQRKPRRGVTKEIRERIEGEAVDAVQR